MKRIKLFLMVASLSLLLSCGGSGDIAGNGSETGNPKIAGRITLNDAPQKNAAVSLYPADYRPGADMGIQQVTTDSTGSFELDHPGGAVNLLAYTADSSVCGFQNIAEGDDLAMDLDLRDVAQVTLQRSSAASGKLLYVQGTPFSADLSEDTAVTLHHMPAGLFRFQDSSDSIHRSVSLEAGDSAVVSAKPAHILVWYGGTSADTAWKQYLKTLGEKWGYTFEEAPRGRDFSDDDYTAVMALPGVSEGDVLSEFIEENRCPGIILSGELLLSLGLADSIGSRRGSTGVLITEEALEHPLSSYLGQMSSIVFRLDIIADTASVLGWAAATAGADVIAKGIDDQKEKYLFTFDPGDPLPGGDTAPVSFAALPFRAPGLNTAGEELLVSSINWCLRP
ncbi:MAG: hypothetical protein ACQEQV_02885 [Fibrobacterota bacterium]